MFSNPGLVIHKEVVTKTRFGGKSYYKIRLSKSADPQPYLNKCLLILIPPNISGINVNR